MVDAAHHHRWNCLGQRRYHCHFLCAAMLKAFYQACAMLSTKAMFLGEHNPEAKYAPKTKLHKLIKVKLD